jgi:hypothetical protein
MNLHPGTHYVHVALVQAQLDEVSFKLIVDGQDPGWRMHVTYTSWQADLTYRILDESGALRGSGYMSNGSKRELHQKFCEAFLDANGMHGVSLN